MIVVGLLSPLNSPIVSRTLFHDGYRSANRNERLVLVWPTMSRRGDYPLAVQLEILEIVGGFGGVL